ncbi:hypothetical protein [Christiangramia salexigens]|uniref:hypothetical protein n=1 Tax=Christiangramia salexigens TaxID=1913577 RepID=UPI0012ECA4D8|nr:hypothetical protein [Christiangramia salexigens]
MKCPVCGKEDKVIPIQYGAPTPDAFELEKAGQLILGSYIISSFPSDWYCKRDDLEF